MDRRTEIVICQGFDQKETERNARTGILNMSSNSI